MEILSLIGILVGLALLIVLAFKGFHVGVITIAACIVIALFSRMSIVETFTTYYMAGFAGFMQGYAPVLVIAAVFAAIMQYTGAIQNLGMALANFCRSILPPKYLRFGTTMIIGVLFGALLTYGGVNLFVIGFLLFPLGRTLDEELDIPWHLSFCGGLGTATFTMGYLPGSPQIQNIIPTQYLGTTVTAGPILGIIATIITLVLGAMYIYYACRKTEKRGEGFFPTGEGVAKAIPKMDMSAQIKPINIVRSVIPLVVMIALMCTSMEVLTAMAITIGVLVLLFIKEFVKADIKKMFGEGVVNGLNASVMVACIIGFGTVVKYAPGFTVITNALLNIPAPPMIQYIIAVEVAAGVCGSSSGGLGIALGAFAEKFMAMGLNPAAMHRLGAIASCGLDSLPHTSGIYVSLAISHLTHRQCYIHQFWLTVVIPVITVIIVTAIYMATGIL